MEGVEELTVDEVNEIVSHAFGKGFSGDNFEHGGDVTEGILSRTDSLGLIGSHGFSSAQYFSRLAGVFGKNDRGDRDGSVIVVKPKYSTQALRYAQEYKEKTGRVVDVRLTETHPFLN